MLPTLRESYEQCIAPELVRGNLKHNKRSVDPPYIVEAMRLREERNKNKVPSKPQI